MTKDLDFSRLIPARDTFTDEDGSVHEFRSRLDFGAQDAARAEAAMKKLEAAQSRMRNDPTDVEAINLFEAASRGFLRIILPSLSEERLQALTLGQIGVIIEWWNAQQSDLQSRVEAEGLGESGAGRQA